MLSAMVTSVPDRSPLQKKKTVEESQIFQTFSKINQDIQAQDRKEMEIKLNAVYFVQKRNYPFLNLKGCFHCREKMESALILRMQMRKVAQNSCHFCLHASYPRVKLKKLSIVQNQLHLHLNKDKIPQKEMA